MKYFFKKLAFSLATCVSVTSCLNAEELLGEPYNIQLKYWEKQPIRYKISIDIIGEKSITINVDIPGKGGLYRTFKKDDVEPYWYLRWMNCSEQDCHKVELFILPSIVKYENHNICLPLISYHIKNSVCNIFSKNNPVWKFVDEYLKKYWSKSWCTKDISREKTVKCENETGDFNEKSFISRICYCVGDSFLW